MDSGAAAIAYLIGVALTLYVGYLIIRAAVRTGVKSAVQDVLEDPGLRLQLLDLIDPKRVETE